MPLSLEGRKGSFFFMPPGATQGRGTEDLTGEVLRGGFLKTRWDKIRFTLPRIMTWEGEVEEGGGRQVVYRYQFTGVLVVTGL